MTSIDLHAIAAERERVRSDLLRHEWQDARKEIQGFGIRTGVQLGAQRTVDILDEEALGERAGSGSGGHQHGRINRCVAGHQFFTDLARVPQGWLFSGGFCRPSDLAREVRAQSPDVLRDHDPEVVDAVRRPGEVCGFCARAPFTACVACNAFRQLSGAGGKCCGLRPVARLREAGIALIAAVGRRHPTRGLCWIHFWRFWTRSWTSRRSGRLKKKKAL